MAENGGGNSFLGFILGGLVVVVAIMGFLMYSGAIPGMGGSGKSTTINIQTPKTN